MICILKSTYEYLLNCSYKTECEYNLIFCVHLLEEFLLYKWKLLCRHMYIILMSEKSYRLWMSAFSFLISTATCMVTPSLGSPSALASAAVIWCPLSSCPMFHGLYMLFLCPFGIFSPPTLLVVKGVRVGSSEFLSCLPSPSSSCLQSLDTFLSIVPWHQWASPRSL